MAKDSTLALFSAAIALFVLAVGTIPSAPIQGLLTLVLLAGAFYKLYRLGGPVPNGGPVLDVKREDEKRRGHGQTAPVMDGATFDQHSSTFVTEGTPSVTLPPAPSGPRWDVISGGMRGRAVCGQLIEGLAPGADAEALGVGLFSASRMPETEQTGGRLELVIAAAKAVTDLRQSLRGGAASGDGSVTAAEAVGRLKSLRAELKGQGGAVHGDEQGRIVLQALDSNLAWATTMTRDERKQDEDGDCDAPSTGSRKAKPSTRWAERRADSSESWQDVGDAHDAQTEGWAEEEDAAPSDDDAEEEAVGGTDMGGDEATLRF